MRKTITVRLPDEVADWLSKISLKTGMPRGQIVREQLEKAQVADNRQFLSLAGKISGPRDLSQRKGFSRS
jgi:predicted DNA-binding protein